MQCERLSIHINVVIALIFFYIINIIYAEPILSGGINKRRPDTHLDTVILFFNFLPTYLFHNFDLFLGMVGQPVCVNKIIFSIMFLQLAIERSNVSMQEGHI